MNAKRRIRPFRSTARAATGGAVVIAALLALLFFRSPGVKDGSQETAPDASQTDSRRKNPLLTTADPSRRDMIGASGGADDSEQEEPSGEPPTEEQRALADGVLTVLVDEREYLLFVPPRQDGQSPTWVPTTLDRIIVLAGQAEGDSNGIRVRIQRRETARASAEHQLTNELQRAGIGKDAVYMSSEFVP